MLEVHICMVYLLVVSVVLNKGYVQADRVQLPVEITRDFTTQQEDTELKLVHVLFRHGDRTPDREEMELYYGDPNIDNTFYPYGIKALTNAGKLREYNVGLFLREMYDGFLDSVYLPEEIYVRTTDYDRTKMSALACLAALYPPDESQQWHPELMWQPIPYHTIQYSFDDMLYYYICPRFDEARTEMLYSPKFQEKLEPYREFFKTMRFHTETNITTPEEVFFIDNLFQAEANYDIPPPKWAEPIMDKIKEMTVIEYELQFSTDELKKVAGGILLQKMIKDSYARVKDTLQPPGRRMFLYSGHENNVAALLACSGVFKAHQPAYGSTYILELHYLLKSKIYAFRVIYLREVGKPAEVLPIPDCGEFCPFDMFVQLTKNTVSHNFEQDCKNKHT